MINEKLLKDMYNLSIELYDETSPSSKVMILRRYSSCKKLLSYIYDSDKAFHITGDKVLEKGNANYRYSEKCLFDILEALTLKTVRGQQALDLCYTYMEEHREYRMLIVNILNKNMESGIGASIINKAFPGIIPDFKRTVPLAVEYKEGMFREGERIFVSRKLDGIRCLCFIEEGKATFYSRNGKQFHTLDVLKKDIEKSYIGSADVILDGELCIFDENGDEDFKAITKEFRRRNHTIKNPGYVLFDIYDKEDFVPGNIMQEYYGDRYKKLLGFFQFEHTIVLEQTCIEFTSEEVHKYMDSIPESWEGIMLRRGKRTSFKRSKDLVKMKLFKEGEFAVTAVTETTKLISGISQICVGSLQIDYKEFTVGVGSGLTDAQRLDWCRNPDKIIGKKITVKYQGESDNDQGGKSLRFPVFKGIRDYE